MKRSLICLTPGDLNGIGLELIIKSYIKNKEIFKDVFLICNRKDMLSYIILLDEDIEINFFENFEDIKDDFLNVYSYGDSTGINSGKISSVHGKASYDYVVKSIDLYKKGYIKGVVTLPICKESWYKAGIRFPGHTEVFADQFDTSDYNMIMYSPEFSVILVTIHQALSSVGKSLSVDIIKKTLKNSLVYGKKLYGDSLSIAVSSFNPHCGEGGYIGDEEENIRKALIGFSGEKSIHNEVLAADTLFYKIARGDFNMAVCMYHDQGLIPFKMVNFDDGVNITCGIDMVRTSPDHGTAFDIAGKGIAKEKSFLSALKVARKLIDS